MPWHNRSKELFKSLMSEWSLKREVLASSQRRTCSIRAFASPARWLLKQSTNSSSWTLNRVAIPSQLCRSCSRQATSFKGRLLSGSATSAKKNVPEIFGPSMISAVSRFWISVNVHAIHRPLLPGRTVRFEELEERELKRPKASAIGTNGPKTAAR